MVQYNTANQSSPHQGKHRPLPVFVDVCGVVEERRMIREINTPQELLSTVGASEEYEEVKRKKEYLYTYPNYNIERWKKKEEEK